MPVMAIPAQKPHAAKSRLVVRRAAGLGRQLSCDARNLVQLLLLRCHLPRLRMWVAAAAAVGVRLMPGSRCLPLGMQRRRRRRRLGRITAIASGALAVAAGCLNLRVPEQRRGGCERL